MRVEKLNSEEKNEKGCIDNMYIPLPFPMCSRCHKRDSESHHRSCGGLLEIDPTNNEVCCKKCGIKWNILDSKYYCNCGNVFQACEVKESVDELIEMCKLCAEELDLMQEAYWKRHRIASFSWKSFVENFFRSLGYAAGVVFEKLVEFTLRYFL